MRTLIILVLVLFTPLSYAKRQPTVQTPAAYAIWDIDAKKILADKNVDSIRSMASITKLMTVLVALEQNLPHDELLTVTGTEHSYYIHRGMKISRGELVNITLVSSDNLAARTLAENSRHGYTDFIALMNVRALSLGMTDTRYEDATGLSAGNVSTVYDIRTLIEVTQRYQVYKQAAMSPVVSVTAIVKNKVKNITARNTNVFAGKLDIIGAKTGFTNAAGRCLTMMFTKNNHTYILVVLGATSPEQRQRMVNKLIDTIT
jgi:D-alanyl-D-alanine endopeptidase (penicillin-binding protein 7)